MRPLSPDLFAFASRFRAQLQPADGVEELLVDGLVASAIRLKRLYADPSALEPYGAPEWDRAHDQASRAFFRHYDRLERRRRASTEPKERKPARPLPAAIELNRPSLAPAHVGHVSNVPVNNPTPAEPAPPTSLAAAADHHAEQAPLAPDHTRLADRPLHEARQHHAEQAAPDHNSTPSSRRRPDPEQLRRRERERRKRERREQRRNPQTHPLATPTRSPARASPAAA